MPVRIVRINQLLQEELSHLLEEDAEELGMLAVVAVETSRDLSQATVFIAPVSEQPHTQLAQKLAERSHDYRQTLKRRLSLKRIPSLRYVFDQNQDRYRRLEALFEEIHEAS